MITCPLHALTSVTNIEFIVFLEALPTLMWHREGESGYTVKYMWHAILLIMPRMEGK